uniref:HPP transmembrane region domain-containing protein n=1 Tax=Lactuca sativa TaxID=4236 RepID=A0A9R1XW45_LACSA|nr:hypothetical protein LSAT_V11C100005260 [Lactuca sativa]
MSAVSSSYISNIVRIRQDTHHAFPFRLRLPPSLVGASGIRRRRRRATSESQSKTRLGVGVRVRATGKLATGTLNWDSWKPDQGSKAPSLSDIFWPSAGAFAAMAVLGKMDQMLAKKGVAMTIAPLGAVCAVLFATPSTPGARVINPSLFLVFYLSNLLYMLSYHKII